MTVQQWMCIRLVRDEAFCVGAEEMALWIKCLSCKHGSLSSHLQHPWEKPVWQHLPVMLALEG